MMLRQLSKCGITNLKMCHIEITVACENFSLAVTVFQVNVVVPPQMFRRQPSKLVWLTSAFFITYGFKVWVIIEFRLMLG